MVLQLYCWDWAKRGSASWLHVASGDFPGSASYFEFILLFGFIVTSGSLVATQFPLSKPSLCLDTSKRIDFGRREALPTIPNGLVDPPRFRVAKCDGDARGLDICAA